MRFSPHNRYVQPTRRAAFTLVELLIVILILGILATIGTGRFIEASLEADTASLRTTLAGMRDAIEVHSSGSPPATIDGSWFRSGKLPRHPQNSFSAPAVQIDGTANKFDPAYKVLKAGVPGAYWYNPANGSVRARVTAQSTAGATLDFYNRVNDTDYTSTSALGNFTASGIGGS